MYHRFTAGEHNPPKAKRFDQALDALGERTIGYYITNRTHIALFVAETAGPVAQPSYLDS
jgi:hypothetical protein